MDDEVLALTDVEIQTVLDEADVRFRALLGLIALAGLSPRQALSLRRDDVKLNEYPPRIDVRVAYHVSVDEVPRSIEIDTPLDEYLRDHLQNASHLSTTAPLFSAPDGRPLTTRWAQRELEVLRENVALGPIKLRDLRRAAKWAMLRRGLTPSEIQRRMGLTGPLFVGSAPRSGKRRVENRSVAAKTRVGRPRKNMERDAELARMLQQPDATSGTVARDYNRLHPGEKELQRRTVKRAIERHLAFLSKEAKS